jgi:uncharacterized membrane protein YwzB
MITHLLCIVAIGWATRKEKEDFLFFMGSSLLFSLIFLFISGGLSGVYQNFHYKDVPANIETIVEIKVGQPKLFVFANGQVFQNHQTSITKESSFIREYTVPNSHWFWGFDVKENHLSLNTKDLAKFIKENVEL